MNSDASSACGLFGSHNQWGIAGIVDGVFNRLFCEPHFSRRVACFFDGVWNRDDLEPAGNRQRHHVGLQIYQQIFNALQALQSVFDALFTGESLHPQSLDTNQD